MPNIDRIEGFADELTAIRRDLHAHPEIGFEEVRTSGIVAEKLTQWGIEVHRGLGGTGVIGVLKGKGSGGLRIGGVRVVVGSRKAQLADQAMFRYVGIEPTEQSILVNKSSVHFRADFQPIAEAVLVAKAPGPLLADPADYPWTRLRKGLCLRPLGPAFTG